MIRQLVVLAVAATCLAGSTTARSFDAVVSDGDKQRVQDYSDLLLSDFLYKELHPEIIKNAKKFNYEEFLARYENKEALTDFWKMYQYGMLSPDHIFSVFEDSHLEQAKVLFDAFYYAPDQPTFEVFASWVRQHVNEEMFIYVYYITVIHRGDTRFIILPPLYKILPNLFFNNDFMTEYNTYMFAFKNGHASGEGVEYMQEPIYANYTHTYMTNTRDPETHLTYFFEDIDMNLCYFYKHLLNPFWMSSSEYPITTARGGLFASTIKWIYNRFEMERYSYGMKPVEFIDWNKQIQTGYTPMMMHSNGMMFPQRPEWSSVRTEYYSDVDEVIGYEKRVSEAIDYSYIAGSNGKFIPITDDFDGYNVMGNIIEGNEDSLNRKFYGSLDHAGRKILGFGMKGKDQYSVQPGAVESYVTSFRDPGFFRHVYKLKYFMDKFDKHIQPRNSTELIDEHFSLTSFKVDPVITYFESHVFPISNVTGPNDSTFLIKARQTRLNIKNFKYYYKVASTKIEKVSIRVYVGPPFANNKPTHEDVKKFYQVDYFTYNLVVGENNIERHLSDSPLGVPDFETFPYGEDTIHKLAYAWPQRMLFPKGTCEGLPAVFYVYITKFTPYEKVTTPLVFYPPVSFELDNKPWDMPFDKPLNDYYKDPHFYPFHIYHKDESHLNLTI